MNAIPGTGQPRNRDRHLPGHPGRFAAKASQAAEPDLGWWPEPDEDDDVRCDPEGDRVEFASRAAYAEVQLARGDFEGRVVPAVKSAANTVLTHGNPSEVFGSDPEGEGYVREALRWNRLIEQSVIRVGELDESERGTYAARLTGALYDLGHEARQDRVAMLEEMGAHRQPRPVGH